MLAMVHSGDADVLRPGSKAARLAGGYGFEREEHAGTWLRVFVETAVSATVEAVDDGAPLALSGTVNVGRCPQPLASTARVPSRDHRGCSATRW
jgi:hypothetical protein